MESAGNSKEIMDISITIPPEEIRKAQRELANYDEVVGKGLQRLITRSTYRVSGQAKRNAPVKFGKLRQAITEKVTKLTGEIAVNVDYGGVVEFGSKAHIIRPNKKKALAFKPGGGFRFWNESGRMVVKFVRHPGTKAQPFLRPAMEKEAPHLAKSIGKMIEDATKQNKR